MKTIKYVIFVVIIIVGLFLINHKFKTLSNSVKIDFVNKSNSAIKKIEVFPLGSIILNISKGESKSITFKHKGEGVYSFSIEFENGIEMDESERYIETGYCVQEFIYNDTIITKY